MIYIEVVDEKEYNEVVKQCNISDIDIVPEITQIFKVVNEKKQQEYEEEKEKMRRNMRKNQTFEEQLFHGTPRINVPSIVCNGFQAKYNRRFILQRGTHFTSVFSDAYMYTYGIEGGFIFLSSVLIGKPLKDTSTRKTHCYVSNTTARNKIYIVNDDSKCYPRYLIMFDKKFKNIKKSTKYYFCSNCIKRFSSTHYKRHKCKKN